MFGSREFIKRNVTISILIFMLENFFSDFERILNWSIRIGRITLWISRDVLLNVTRNLQSRPTKSKHKSHTSRTSHRAKCYHSWSQTKQNFKKENFLNTSSFDSWLSWSRSIFLKTLSIGGASLIPTSSTSNFRVAPVARETAYIYIIKAIHLKI